MLNVYRISRDGQKLGYVQGANITDAIEEARWEGYSGEYTFTTLKPTDPKVTIVHEVTV